MLRFTILDVLWLTVAFLAVLSCIFIAIAVGRQTKARQQPKLVVVPDTSPTIPVELEELMGELWKTRPSAPLDYSGLKLEPFDRPMPPNLSLYLGKTRAEFLAATKLTPDLDGRDERDEVVTLTPPEQREQWRSFVIMFTWSDETGKSEGRPLSIWYRADTDQIWLIQLPAQKDSDLPSVGPISVRDRFDDCVARLGQPTYTIKGRAWWEVNETTYRVEHYIKPYRHLGVDYAPGEITWIAAYRRDLAPPNYDDGRSWWEKHFNRLEGKQSP